MELVKLGKNSKRCFLAIQHRKLKITNTCPRFYFSSTEEEKINDYTGLASLLHKKFKFYAYRALYLYIILSSLKLSVLVYEQCRKNCTCSYLQY